MNLKCFFGFHSYDIDHPEKYKWEVIVTCLKCGKYCWMSYNEWCDLYFLNCNDKLRQK